jgi:hypothetical protein
MRSAWKACADHSRLLDRLMSACMVGRLSGEPFVPQLTAHSLWPAIWIILCCVSALLPHLALGQGDCLQAGRGAAVAVVQRHDAHEPGGLCGGRPQRAADCAAGRGAPRFARPAHPVRHRAPGVSAPCWGEGGGRAATHLHELIVCWPCRARPEQRSAVSPDACEWLPCSRLPGRERGGGG